MNLITIILSTVILIILTISAMRIKDGDIKIIQLELLLSVKKKQAKVTEDELDRVKNLLKEVNKNLEKEVKI